MPLQHESYLEGLQRVGALYNILLDMYGDQNTNVLLVGHYHAGARLLEYFMDQPPEGRIDHKNTGMSCIEGGPLEPFKAVFLNR